MNYLIISIFIISSLFFRLDRHFLKQNGSFSPKFIYPNWSKCPQFDTSNRGNLGNILNQPYTYLTKGRQCFVFVSEDRNWVIKFFRLPRYAMRYSYKGKALSALSLRNILEISKSAIDDLYEETNIVYAHLKQTENLEPISLTDRMGVHYLCDLNDLPFLVQRYGAPFFEVFDKDKNPKELIFQTVALFEKLYAKGYLDLDPILDKNFGVADKKPFIMDIGQIEKSTSLPTKQKYLELMTHSLGLKLERESPELYIYYKNLLH